MDAAVRASLDKLISIYPTWRHEHDGRQFIACRGNLTLVANSADQMVSFLEARTAPMKPVRVAKESDPRAITFISPDLTD